MNLSGVIFYEIIIKGSQLQRDCLKTHIHCDMVCLVCLHFAYKYIPLEDKMPVTLSTKL